MAPGKAKGKAVDKPLLQLFHNVWVEIEIHLSLLCALNRSNSKTVPNFVGRDTISALSLDGRFNLTRFYSMPKHCFAFARNSGSDNDPQLAKTDRVIWATCDSPVPVSKLLKLLIRMVKPAAVVPI